MLQTRLSNTRDASLDIADGTKFPSKIELHDYGGFVRRQLRTVILTSSLFVALATMYVVLRQQSFLASATVLVETHKPELKQGSSGEVPDPAIVDSQLEILKSDQTFANFLEAQNLASDPMFKSPSWIDAIKLRIPHHELLFKDTSDDKRDMKRMIDKLRKLILVKRVGVTNLLAVETRLPDPVKSARFSNGLVDSYLNYQHQVKEEQAQKAEHWLKDRIDQMETRLHTAEREAFDSTYIPRTKRIELDSNLQGIRNIRDNFLKRVADSAELIKYVTPEARVVSPALPAASEEGPAAPLIVASSLVLGICLALFIGFAREQLDGTIRSPQHALEIFGFHNIAILPAVGKSETVHLRRALRERHDAILARYASLQQKSRFATVIRSLKIMAGLHFGTDDCVVIGVTSVLPDEGSNLLVSNLGFYAQLHDKSLIIEAGGQKTIFPIKKTRAIPNVADGRRTRTDVDATSTVCESGLPDIVSIGETDHLTSTGKITEQRLSAIVEGARKKYKYVIINLPPLLASPEALGISPFVDCFILAIQWGKTSRRAVVEALLQTPEVTEKTLSAVLTFAPRHELQRLEYYKGKALPRVWRT